MMRVALKDPGAGLCYHTPDQRQHPFDLGPAALDDVAPAPRNCNPRSARDLRHYPLRITHGRAHQSQHPPIACFKPRTGVLEIAAARRA
jgi:hypothetical protein